MDFRRERVGWLAVVLVMLLALTACGAPSPATVRRTGRRSARRVLPLTIGVQGGWGPTWSLNPLSAGFLPQLYGYALVPLALEIPPSLGRYQPVLATSWHTTPGEVTVRLRRDAHWQNGRAVSATDVITAAELQGAIGNNVWSAVTGIRSVGRRTVVAKVRAGRSSALVLQSLLAISPLPTSEYGKFVTHGLEQTLIARWHNPASAAGRSAKAALERVFDRVEDYHPATFLGDGPYRLTNAVTGSVLLTKWVGFWDASKIRVGSLLFYPVTISPVTPSPPSHETLDLVLGQFPSLYAENYLAGKGSHQVDTDTFDLSVLAFDEHRYPVNLLAVRQALAEVIDRKTIMALANGGSSPDRGVTYPAGIPPAVLSEWLTPAEQRSLRAYPHDLARAADLLERAGFHRKHGRWYTRAGRRLKITVGTGAVLSLPTDVATATAVGNALARFGIKALAATNVIGDVDWGLSGEDGSLDPLAAVANLLGSPPLFNTSDQDMPANSRPARAQVQGFGTITVATAIDQQAASTSPGTSMRKRAADWASYIDHQLPYLTLAESYEQILYSSARYTHWPGRSSPLWRLIGLNGNAGIVNLLEHASVRPAS